jgi:hypothetical protein
VTKDLAAKENNTYIPGRSMLENSVLVSAFHFSVLIASL